MQLYMQLIECGTTNAEMQLKLFLVMYEYFRQKYGRPVTLMNGYCQFEPWIKSWVMSVN